MSKLYVALFVSMIFLILVPASSAQSCPPAGPLIVGPDLGYFNYVANGSPGSSDCWILGNAFFVTGTTSCGFTSNAFEFRYAGSVYQSFTIPGDDPRRHFQLSYLLDFDDPNHDPAWNRLQVTVRDNTTGTIIADDYYDGGMVSLQCVRRDLSTYVGSLAGHNISINFNGSKAYANTHIRIRSIAFWGSY